MKAANFNTSKVQTEVKLAHQSEIKLQSLDERWYRCSSVESESCHRVDADLLGCNCSGWYEMKLCEKEV